MTMSLDLEKDLTLALEMVIRGVIACEFSDLQQKLKQDM